MSDRPGKWQTRAARALATWRERLSGEDRAGDLAVLSRLAVREDAMLLPCFAELCEMAVGGTGITCSQIEVLSRCAFLAGRLAKFEKGAHLSAAMAKRQVASRPLISPVRAAALFSLEDNDQACAAIASLLGQMGGRIAACLDPSEILAAMANWEQSRRSIALAYYLAISQPEATKVADQDTPSPETA